MADWLAFLAFVSVLTVAVLWLAHSSARLVTEELPPGVAASALRWNVALSQALVAVAVLAAAWLAAVPWSAFGWSGVRARGVLLGVGAGLAFAVANTVLGEVVDARAIRQAEELRELLAPETPAGWLGLLVGVVPVIAVSEELLFRGALVGVAATGLSVSPWLVAIPASLAFGAAHSAQGWVGVAVTAVFGFLLSGVFVLTGDLLVVVVAHAVVDAAEFLLYEAR